MLQAAITAAAAGVPLSAALDANLKAPAALTTPEGLTLTRPSAISEYIAAKGKSVSGWAEWHTE